MFKKIKLWLDTPTESTNYHYLMSILSAVALIGLILDDLFSGY